MKCDTKYMSVFCQETAEDNVEKESEEEDNLEEESEDDKVDEKSKQGCSSKCVELTQYGTSTRRAQDGQGV